MFHKYFQYQDQGPFFCLTIVCENEERNKTELNCAVVDSFRGLSDVMEQDLYGNEIFMVDL
jgi:hypothetical protein